METTNEFWIYLETLCDTVWPAQIFFYCAAILIIGWLFIKPGRVPDLMVKLYLAIAFALNGIAPTLTRTGDISRVMSLDNGVGFWFMIMVILLVVDIFRNKMRFSLPTTGWQRYTTLVLAVLIFCYPLFGIMLGHGFKITFPIPCPTWALGLLLLTMALPRVDKVLYILLLLPLFIVIPLVIIKHCVYEDIILFATGVYSLVLLLKFWKVKDLPEM